MLLAIMGIRAKFDVMLLAFPEATICVFADGAINRTPYANVEHVQLMKSFLDNPSGFSGTSDLALAALAAWRAAVVIEE